MKLGITKIVSFICMAVVLIIACKRNSELNKPTTRAEFLSASGTYAIRNDPSSKFKIPVGLTNVTSEDRTISYTVSSPSGATAGQQYNIVKNGSVVIPAGSAVDSIEVDGLFSGYTSRGKDTLIFNITGGTGVTPFSGASTYTLVMQKFCPLVMSDFSGDFVIVQDDWKDFAIGDVVTLKVSGNTIYFPYPTDLSHKDLPIVVNPNTFATSVAKTVIGGYSVFDATLYSAASVSSTSNVVVPCDKTISVRLNFTAGEDDYGNYVLKLRKK
ncbi:hypothetical protein [Niabella hirudinis]|uniref:hypothetical protein n=1 Tax=Niabella hirudinis TaxID=1285929 RepID=UPI003EBD1FA6